MKRARKGCDYSSEYYSKISGEKDRYKNRGEQVRIFKIISFVGTGNRVLDLGCFDGTIGEILIKNGNEVYGIDASKKAVKLACEKGIKAKVGNIEEKFDFEDNFFDIVVAAEVIEHVLDTDFFIDEIKRVLKPNGFLVLSTPNVASLGRRILLFFGKNPYFEASFGFPSYASAGHIRFFTKSLLLSYLRYKGFEIVKCMSDVVNFSFSGRIWSKLLADIFPTLGRSLIVKARKVG